jgi:hypothetical protein
MGFGDDFRLMTRVLPRPIVLQGGKSMRISYITDEMIDFIRLMDLRDVWRVHFLTFFYGVRGPPLRGGSRGGSKRGGPDPPPNGGRDAGFFGGSKNGQKWSKKVRDGGVSKSAVSGGRGGFSRKKTVGAWGADSLKILSPPPPRGLPNTPLGV